MPRLSLNLGLTGAALLAGIIQILYSRQATGNRILLVSPQAPRSVLNGMSDYAIPFTLLCGQQTVTDPYVTVVQLRCRGRKAITSNDFDQDRPLCVNLGAPIMSLLKTASTRGGNFRVETSGTTVKFGPDLLAAKDRIEVHLLTSGKPTLTAKARPLEYHLADTSVKYVDPRWGQVKRRLLKLGLAIVPVIVILAAQGTIILNRTDFTKPAPSLQVSPINVLPGGTVYVSMNHFAADSRPSLHFMGAAEPVHLVSGGSILSFHVPIDAAPGRHFVVVSYGPQFPVRIFGSFFVR